MKNNFVQLIGFLGEDAKAIHKDGNSYTILNMATNDNYPIQQEGKTEWVKKEAVWHDVFVFPPTAAKMANSLKKGNKLTVTGEIAYKTFRDENGYQRKQAYIVANWIESVVSERKDSPAANAIREAFVADLKERFAACDDQAAMIC